MMLLISEFKGTKRRDTPSFKFAEGQRAAWPKILIAKSYLTVPFVLCLPGTGMHPAYISPARRAN